MNALLSPKLADPLHDEKLDIAGFLEDCSIEVTPGAAAKIPDLSSVFEQNQTVYVTFLPGSKLDDTLETVKRLVEAGMRPKPHIAARSIESHQQLESFLGQLSDLDVRQALLIAGGVDGPLGPFPATLDILKLGYFERFGFTTVGLAGHPEGSPDIPPDMVMQALRDKNAYAAESPVHFHLVTQFCFESAPITAWDRMIRLEAGNQLPIHIGLPGLATIKTLLRHAQACGVGASMRVLTRQAANIAKLMTVNAPDKLVRGLARYAAEDPDCGITHCHLFPLGGLEKSMTWLRAVQAGQITLDKKGGFTPL